MFIIRTDINRILLCVSGNLAKKTWENLRDSYRKKLKARSETKSGQAADNYDTKWPFFASMDFLRDMLIPRESSGNLHFPGNPISSPAYEEDMDDKVVPDEDEFNDSLESGSINVPSATNSREEQPIQSDKGSKTQNIRLQPRKRKSADQALDIEKRKLQLLEERFTEKTRKDDDDYLFLMSLLPSIKQLDPIQKMRLRMSMLESVTRELEKNSFTDAVNNSAVDTPSGSSHLMLTSASPSPQYSVRSVSYTHLIF